MPKYSIIVPIYNTEAFLSTCLDSLVGQTYQDYEIVLVNDGSTDASGEVIEKYRSQHPNRIRVVTQDNHGLLLARRAGYKNSSGSILMTVDSDDYLRTDALERIDACFTEQDVDVVCFAFSRQPDFHVISERKPFTESRYVGMHEKTQLYQLICGTRTMNFAWSKAIKRSLVDVNRDYSDYDGLCCAEDLLQILPVFDRLESFYFLNEALYYYRINNKSITKVFNLKSYWECQRVGLVRFAYAQKWEKTISNGCLSADSLFMSLRETCEAIVRIAELNSIEEARELYDEIGQGELYLLSSAHNEAVRKLHPYYRFIHWLFKHKCHRLLKIASVFMLGFKRLLIKDK